VSGPALTIARFTFHESVRNRLFLFAVILVVCLFGLAEFIGELAITETVQLQASIMGSLLRIFAVFIVSLFVITSMVREFNDKGFELALSLPIRRFSYYLGKLTGFALLGLVIALLAGTPLLLYTDPIPLAAWVLSLFLELLIMIAVSLLCLFTFGNITISFTIVAAFYLLARSMNAIILISDSPLLVTGSLSQEVIGILVHSIAVVIPDLNRFTDTSWLVYGNVGWTELNGVIAQTMIYLLLLTCASLFDLYRKNL